MPTSRVMGSYGAVSDSDDETDHVTITSLGSFRGMTVTTDHRWSPDLGANKMTFRHWSLASATLKPTLEGCDLVSKLKDINNQAR